ncbi:hypothetical protein LCGC14_0243950 [marine sediment metagenome]|uniref:Uncharacterized protein n=1 Tax=marine sediment metagenome TaxID=412755 RepID=A0A0F9XB06_9ZZZZ
MAAKKTVSKKVARKAAKKAKGKGTKKVAPEEDLFRVWVNWEYTRCSGGEICEGEEDSSYPSRETEYKDHEVQGIYSCDAKDGRGWSRYNESIDVEFEPVTGAEVFLVVVTYSSGDTFGSSSGNVTVIGCYEEKAQADSIASDIRADDIDADRDYRRSGKKTKKERFTGYKAWTGYFEGLEGVEVHRLRLDEDSGVKRF